MAETHGFRMGGLMRCCVETIHDQETAHPGEAKEGDVLPCKYCSDSMVLRDGLWSWNHPERVR